MMPITDLLSCTDFIDDFSCFSYHQKHHAKTYVTGLIASGNKTVEGISKRVLRSKSERALNKFLNQYDWDEDRLNRGVVCVRNEYSIWLPSTESRENRLLQSLSKKYRQGIRFYGF